MLHEGKWEAAVDGSVLFYELMKELRHPAFQDRYNSVVFRWNEGGGVDASTTVPAGTGMKDMSTPLTTPLLNAETPIPGYWTPIGEGLQLAIDQFDLDAEESFYSNKTILLLSDGKQNRGIDPLAVTVPEKVKVYAVGLGEDHIEPDTISDIANASGADFRITPSPRELEDFFIQILCNTSWKLQDITIVGDTVPIDEHIAIFIVVWDDPGASLSFELDPPGASANITPGSLAGYPPMEVTYHPPAPGETHAFYVCKNIPDELLGEWHFSNINNGGAPVPLADVLLKVIEDPQTIADFDIENIDHYTGQPIVLTSKVTEDGKPKTGLSEVYAELVRSPAHAVGTLMAENTPPPDYPAQPSAKVDRTLRSHYLLGVMQKLNINRLSKTGGPQIELRDDGLGADVRADDGIYTGVFGSTEYEGSYTFKFRAKGKNKNGVTFDRAETLSEYVAFAAGPAETEVKVVSVVADPDEKIVRSTIKVTPRDASGAYLGPFRGESIRLWASVGNVRPEYDDNKDGSYNFTLIHPIDTVPVVLAAVGDVIVAEQMPVEPERPAISRVLLFIILLIVLIALLCLYYFVWRKS